MRRLESYEPDPASPFGAAWLQQWLRVVVVCGTWYVVEDGSRLQFRRDATTTTKRPKCCIYTGTPLCNYGHIVFSCYQNVGNIRHGNPKLMNHEYDMNYSSCSSYPWVPEAYLAYEG